MSDDKVHLKKSISLFSGCAIIIGSIVGSGIFITAKNILENTGGAPGISLIVWLVSGFIAFVGAICYTELGTLIQTDGGDYAYIKEAYGRLLAFLYTWMMVFVTLPCYNAISALTVSKYVIKPFFMSCESPVLTDKLISALVMVILGLINSLNVNVVSKIQVVFTLSKVAALIIIIGAGFWSFFQSSVRFDDTVKEWFPSDKPFQLEKSVMSIYNCLFAYSGWNCLNFLTGELKNPSKNLPRAIYVSIPIVILIYFITTVAYFLVLSPNEILHSETVAIMFSDKVLHSNLSWLTPFLIAFSTFGSLSAAILTTSRIYYAAAIDGNLPQVFGMVNVKTFSPVVSIFVVVIISILMLLMDNLNDLILYASFSEFLFIGISITTILWFRYKRPKAKRDIKVFLGFPIFFLCICVFMIGLTAYDQPYKTLMGLIFLLLGIPAYYIAVEWKNKPKAFLRFSREITIMCQKLFLCAKDE